MRNKTQMRSAMNARKRAVIWFAVVIGLLVALRIVGLGFEVAAVLR